VEVSHGNAWLVYQTKCLPICVCCQITKLMSAEYTTSTVLALSYMGNTGYRKFWQI